jgi:tetratricopeptide (TPR) repeat protein
VAYDRGDRESIRLGLQRTADPVRLLQDIAAAGNPWPGSAQREADYALELADAALSASGMAGTIAASEVGRLLGRFSRLVRNPVEPDAFERAWLWASICLAEGKFSKVAAAPLVDYALVRFPNDPHFVLARAIVVDQRWRIHGTVGIGGSSEGPEQVTQAYVADVVAKYRAAAAFTETSTEASVRLGWFLHRIGRHADAIATLEAAPAAQDPAMNYLRHIFLGHAFVAVDRLDDAIAAYRLAVADVPDAQSARVALMSALAARGDITGAEALGRQIEMAVSAGDPWFNYWFGDARWYAQARDAVRAFSSSKAGGK